MGSEVKVTHVGDGFLPRDPRGSDLVESIRQVRGVERITLLPDSRAIKLEAPVSIVTQVRDWIVPALGTNVINCGMGIVDTGLQSDEMSEENVKLLCSKIWEAMYGSDYILSREEAGLLFRDGVGALVKMGMLDESDRAAFEFEGSVNPGAGEREVVDIEDCIPLLLRLLKASRRPSRIVLRGNHFIEVQVVERPFDSDRLAALGLKEGRVVLMIHTDHRVTGGLNHHFVVRKTYREKRLSNRVPYAMSKVQFHFASRQGIAHLRDRARLYFLQKGYVGIPLDSFEGKRYLAAYGLGTNYGYAGRGVIYRLCKDVVAREFGGTGARIVWDSNHESMRVKEGSGGRTLVMRKGAVECFAGKPAILPGSFDVPSLLGECLESEATAHSYDHGSSHVRESVACSEVEQGVPPVARYVVGREHRKFEMARVEHHAIRSREPMDLLGRILMEKGAVRPIAWLRPVANLSEE